MHVACKTVLALLTGSVIHSNNNNMIQSSKNLRVSTECVTVVFARNNYLISQTTPMPCEINNERWGLHCIVCMLLSHPHISNFTDT